MSFCCLFFFSPFNLLLSTRLPGILPFPPSTSVRARFTYPHGRTYAFHPLIHTRHPHTYTSLHLARPSNDRFKLARRALRTKNEPPPPVRSNSEIAIQVPPPSIRLRRLRLQLNTSLIHQLNSISLSLYPSLTALSLGTRFHLLTPDYAHTTTHKPLQFSSPLSLSFTENLFAATRRPRGGDLVHSGGRFSVSCSGAWARVRAVFYAEREVEEEVEEH